MTRGAQLEIRPLIDNKPAELDDLSVIWSDGRSWQKGVDPVKTDSGTLRLPTMASGKNSVLLVKLSGDHATHFSKIIDLELTPDKINQIDIELRPSLRIQGKLSDNVTRPVRNGRLKTETLSPKAGDYSRAGWFSWASINPDGTFVIDGWPAGEPMQLIALCDGYIAASGKAPAVVQDPPDPKTDFFNRPQVFEPAPNDSVAVSMKPLVPCKVTAVDEDNAPLAGVTVQSWPNVGWWNDGSQLYCDPLVRGEKLVRVREYLNAKDNSFPEPFAGKTDSQGSLTLELPAGKEDLNVSSDAYELPVFLGRRDQRIQIDPDKPPETILRRAVFLAPPAV